MIARTFVSADQPVFQDRKASIERALIFGFIIILGVENPIRKWLLPSFSSEIYILKYVYIVVLYSFTMLNGTWPKRNSVLSIYYLLLVAAIFVLYCQILLTYNFDIRYFYFGLLGLANNFLFLPLAFIIARIWRADDVRSACKYVIWFALLSAPIVILQFYAPDTAPINTGFASGNVTVFKPLAGGTGLVRPEGMFTNDVAQAVFVTLSFAIVLASMIEGRKLIPIWLTLSGLVAVIFMVLFGSNRTEVSEIVLVMLSGLFFIIKRHGKRDLFFLFFAPAIFFTIGAIVVIQFPESANAFVDRWTSANSGDAKSFQGGFFGRSLYPFYAFIQYIPSTPVYGYLVGICNDAVDSAQWFVLPAADINWDGYGQWGREGGFATQIVELGPIVGIGYIALRLYAFAWFFRQCYGHYQLEKDIIPLMLFSVGGVVLIYLPIVTNGDIGCFCWVILGMALAAIRPRVPLDRSRVAGHVKFRK